MGYDNVVDIATARKPPETTYAKMDPSHCLADGLFRSLAKGQQDREKLRSWHGEGSCADDGGAGFEFVGPDPLGPLELRLLQVIVALAGKDGKVLPEQPKSEDGVMLRQLVDGGRDRSSSPEDRHLFIKTSYYNLVKEIGLDTHNKKVYTRVRKSLSRMASVTLHEQTPARDGKGDPNHELVGTLLTRMKSNGADKSVLVALNARLSGAFLDESWLYRRIEIGEARKLSDTAVIVHTRLCAAVNQGKSWSFKIDTLASYAWPDKKENAATLRTRSRKIRGVLVELAGLGWGVEETSPAVFRITRPSRRSSGGKAA